MSPEQMRRAIGIMLELLTKAAWDGRAVDGGDAQEAMLKAGLTFVRPATEQDLEVDNSGYLEVGDDFHVLTDFARQCFKERLP